LAEWQQILLLVERDEAEKAASLARVSAERLLRLLLYFYCYCGHESTFVSVVKNPGTLRVPDRLARAVERNSVVATITEDGWADLGFLAIALRKFSGQLEANAAQHLSGDAMVIFASSESEAFTNLGKALQPYAHDRPSSQAGKQSDLQKAVERASAGIKDMIGRGIVPDQLVITEICESVTGPVFRGITEDKHIRHLATSTPPALGQRIWYVASADRDLANCVWSPVPWA
jgi:hypothetical protein